jgi:hypothetical protein
LDCGGLRRSPVEEFRKSAVELVNKDKAGALEYLCDLKKAHARRVCRDKVGDPGHAESTVPL